VAARIASVLFLLGVLPGSCVSLASAEDFYKDKAVKIFIGSGPGGGYDLFGRLVARHIGEHLPGRPAVTPQNMPGAGSVLATNYIYNVAPKDGLALAIASPSLSLIEALQTTGVRFKAEKLNWIGRISPNINVTVTWKSSSVKTILDARNRELLLSAISASSPLTLMSQVMNATAGTKFKLVRGYADSASTLLAMERGEAEGTTVSWATLKATRADFIRNGSVNILVQYALSRTRDLPEVPSAPEIAISDEDKRLLSLVVSAADVGYAIFTSPGVPEARVNILRRAFQEMTRDPAFKSDVEALGIDPDPMFGAELQKTIESTTALPETIRARAREVAKSE
jgi:tripartite-type tricarboxylate transporter receptor subunit TctC